MVLETNEQKIIRKKNETFLKSCGMSSHEYTEEEAFDILLKEKVAVLLETVSLMAENIPTIDLRIFTLKNNGISDGEQRRQINELLKKYYAFKRNNSNIKIILVNKMASENYRKHVTLI